VAFHETARFPTDISYGSKGGPGFNTNVIELRSGQETRIGRMSKPKRRFNAVYGIRDQDDLGVAYEFYIARDGVLNGFRYKDWLDYTTAANHRDAPSDTDVLLGAGDGATTVFQLKKIYSNAGIDRNRIIEKPIHGETVDGVAYNVLVSLDDVSQSSGWTVNTTTGQITFSTAPGAGVQVKAGCAFDVPARFGKEVDFNLSIQIDGFNAAAIPDIPIVELLDERAIDEEQYNGGGTDHGAVNDAVSITTAQGLIHRFAPTSAMVCTLPDYANIPPGGPIFFIVNDGTANVTVQNHLSTNVVVVGASASATLYLSLDSGGAKEWLAT